MNVAFHFVALRDGAPILRDGRALPAAGEWLEETGEIEICRRGLHASWRAFDALGYASDESLGACFVEVDDVVTEHNDKFVCRRRRVIGWAPCDDVLRLFAREAALSVLHLWQGEVPAVLREYLETGNEAIRAAAWDAARPAARDAAWSAAGDAAGDAAWSAARDAARAAAISNLNVTLESMLLAAIGAEL